MRQGASRRSAVILLAGFVGGMGTPMVSEAAICSFACIWTGEVVMIWNGETGYALAPDAEEWRRLTDNPRASRGAEPRLLLLENGDVMAAYWGTVGDYNLNVDRYIRKEDGWTGDVTLNQDWFDSGNTGSLRIRTYDIEGIVEMGEGSVVFVSSNGSREVIGIRIPSEGGPNLISDRNAPQPGGADTAIYERDGQVFYFGYSHIQYNHWSLWNSEKEEWRKPQETGPLYSFAHCLAGDDVYIFGGALSSAFGIIQPFMKVFSFEDLSWRQLELPEIGDGRRNCSLCWTGEEIISFGGFSQGEDAFDLDYDVEGNGYIFDPSIETWTPLPMEDGPSARTDHQCVWTGKEMIILGGIGEDRQCLSDVFGFDPAQRSWRELPEIPEDFYLAELADILPPE